MLSRLSFLVASAAVAHAISIDTYSSGADYPFVVHNPGKSGKQAAMIFLHGSGSCGSDLSSNPFWDGLGYMMHQSGDAATLAQEEMVSILPLHPPCNSAIREWDPSSVKSVINLAKSKYNIDDDRFYCGGYSMGAKGTWVLAMSEPTLCKKLIVSAGYTEFSSSLNKLDTSDLSPLKDIPMQLFAGTSDDKQPASTTAGPVVSLLKSLSAPAVTYETFNTDHGGMSRLPWQQKSLWEWVQKSSGSSSSPSSSSSSADSSESDSSATSTSSSAKASSTTKTQGVKANAVQSDNSGSSSTTSNSKCKAGSSSASRRRRQRRALLAAESSGHFDRRHLSPRHPGQPKKFDYGGPHGSPA